MAEITDIASYLTTHLPQGDVADGEAREAWRRQLRHAKATGASRWLADLVEQQDPADPTLKAHCETLRRP